MKIINCGKKEITLLTHEKNEFYENQKFCYICKKRFTINNEKVKDHCQFTGKHRGAAHNNGNMDYKI